jgi:hypothetical protein
MLSQPNLELLPEQPGAADNEVRSQVRGLLTTLYPQHDWVERRSEGRYAFPYLIHLTPVGRDGLTPHDQGIVVVGKHLSERGLDFYHREPLPYRRMIASLEGSNGHWLGFLIDLRWCRFTKHGWYESGGRFLQAVLSPVEQ